jgi:hypothetical protein
MYQNLNAGLGFVQPGLNREALFIQLSTPIVAGDGEQMRISEERDKRAQRLS